MKITVGEPKPHDWPRAYFQSEGKLAEGEKLVKSRKWRKYYHGSCPYRTKYSFININGTTVAIDNDKRSRLSGHDASIVVKYAYDEKGYRYRLKIEDNAIVNPHEYDILDDLNILVGQTTRNRPLTNKLKKHKKPRAKHYALMEDLGVDLKTYLQKHLLTDEERLKLALDITLAVLNLHTGKASKSGKTYAHLDLKPSNITVTPDGRIKIIDFGFALDGPNTTCPSLRGTPLYLSASPIKKPAHVLDLIALQRTLYAPKEFSIFLFGSISEIHIQRSTTNPAMPYVLTDKLLDTKKLRPYIDTSNAYLASQEKDLSVSKLAAILILANHHLEDYYELIDNKLIGKELIPQVIAIHQKFSSKAAKKKLSIILNKSKQSLARMSSVSIARKVVDEKIIRPLISQQRPASPLFFSHKIKTEPTSPHTLKSVSFV